MLRWFEAGLLHRVGADLRAEHRFHDVEQSGVAEQTEKGGSGVAAHKMRIESFVVQGQGDSEVVKDIGVLSQKCDVSIVERQVLVSRGDGSAAVQLVGSEIQSLLVLDLDGIEILRSQHIGDHQISLSIEQIQLLVRQHHRRAYQPGAQSVPTSIPGELR